jgi:ribA/ribD-fused uncharacterized protein
MPEAIRFYSRKDEYGWLSNFWRHTQAVHSVSYPTNEHFYQSQKAVQPDVSEWIRVAPSPWLAMRAGRSLRANEMRDDWDEVKVDVMLTGLRAKFAPGSELASMLLATGDAVLEEDSPTDMFWGRLGKNTLGKCLMRVRDELRKGST